MGDKTKQLKPGHEWVIVNSIKVIAIDKSHDRSWVIYVNSNYVDEYFDDICYPPIIDHNWKPIPKPRPMTQLEAWAKLADFFLQGIVPSIKRKKGGYWHPAFGYNLSCPEELEYKIPGDDTVYQFEVQE